MSIDLRNLFKLNGSLNRWEFFKTICCLQGLILLIYVLMVFIPPKGMVLINTALSLFIILSVMYGYLMVVTICKRFNNLSRSLVKAWIFTGIYAVLEYLHYFHNTPKIISVIIWLILFISAIFLYFVKGKLESSKIISTKYFWIFITILLIISITLKVKLHKIIYYAKSTSMQNTLLLDDSFLVNKKEKNFKRGDLVLIKSQKTKNRETIRRIIALPEETVEIINNDVYINDKKLEEKYLDSELKKFECGILYDCHKKTIPKNSYYVLGDNRKNSLDSRTIGSIDKSEIIGKAMYIFYPLKRRKLL